MHLNNAANVCATGKLTGEVADVDHGEDDCNLQHGLVEDAAEPVDGQHPGDQPNQQRKQSLDDEARDKATCAPSLTDGRWTAMVCAYRDQACIYTAYRITLPPPATCDSPKASRIVAVNINQRSKTLSLSDSQYS